MDLPSVMARDLMGSQFDDWIDMYCLESLPEEDTDGEDKTICLIQEWLSEPEYYANAKLKGWQVGVDVRFWFWLGVLILALVGIHLLHKP